MLNVLGIIILLVLIGLSIGLHEIGHLLPAKKFGVKVIDYAIGFGPTVFKRKRGETEYHLKLIPLGGYIRMIGMYPPAKADKPARAGRFADLIEQARQTSAEEVLPGEESRTFYRLPVRKRLVIMLGGPLMNLGLAAILFAIVLSVIGVTVASNSIGRLIPCVPTQSDPSGAGSIAGCGDAPVSPAVAAGLKVGDTIVSIDGVATPTYADVAANLRTHKIGDEISLNVENAAGNRTVNVVMADAVVEQFDQQGNPLGTFEHRPLVGFVPAAKLEPLAMSEVPGLMWDMTVMSVKALMTFPQKLYQLGQNLVTGQERDPNGPISVVGVSRLSGEVVASDLEWQMKAQEILGMAASLNLFLFLFNLVPLLPLDGGHVAAGIVEGVRARWARLRKKPDPGPIDVARALPLTYFFSAILLFSGVLVIVADLVAPISLGY